MALTLCPNCRLPVNAGAQRCPLCAGEMRSAPATRHVPLAAAVALIATATATVAVLARRLA